MTKAMSLDELKSFYNDIVQYAKYLQWDNDVGKNKAQEIADEIHAGKYGDKQGLWVQADNFLEALTQWADEQVKQAVDDITYKWYLNIDSANNAHLWGDYGFSEREAWSGVNKILDEMKSYRPKNIDNWSERVKTLTGGEE